MKTEALIDEMCATYPELRTIAPQVENAYETLVKTFESGGKLLLCGNGGSAADCDHIVGELMKGFMLKRKLGIDERAALIKLFPANGNLLAENLQQALPAISLCNHSALITAFANDVSPEMVFAQQVYGYGKKGDALLCLSTSGNSVNVIRALQIAKLKGLSRIGLTGAGGGKMKEFCDVLIEVPSNCTPAVQERHLPIYHTLCRMVEARFFVDAKRV